MVKWKDVDTVLLDMDGTLLDLHFDDYFWRELVPRRYAEKNNLKPDEARQSLMNRYRRLEGTLDWYSVDFWTQELGLDIPLLKLEVEHLIEVQPHVVEFLDTVRASGRRCVLVTNAHGKSLDIKMKKTELGGHLDALVCAHDLGLPKEEMTFWARLREVEPFDPERTLLVDDSLPVLESAHRYGIRYVVGVRRPNTKEPSRPQGRFPAISDFRDLVPGDEDRREPVSVRGGERTGKV